jgi:hypothetical protein
MSDAWVGALGGLLGVVVGSALQMLAAHSARSGDRRQRIRDELLDAFTHFAGACVEYRRSQIHLRKLVLRNEVNRATLDAADADRKAARASAWTAFGRTCLLGAGPDIDKCARELLGVLKGLKYATTENIDRLGVEAHWKIQEFTKLACRALPMA